MSNQSNPSRKWSKVPIASSAVNCFNPIRSIVDTMRLTPNPDKTMISLTIGDPTIYGNLPRNQSIEEALVASLKSRKCNGYGPSIGYEHSRQAVADYVSIPACKVNAEDIVLTSGCSGALELCLKCLAGPGQNILIPRPGFSIYKTIADTLGIQVRQYDLLPDRSWQVDIPHLESLADDNTAAIFVVNPSNPCGSVYDEEHLRAIIAAADRCRVPIISDEIYDNFVFSGHTFHPLASLSENVPILTCGGLTKRFLVPGWRLGWIVVHDRNSLFTDVKNGLRRLSQVILGPNTVVQGALPQILAQTPQAFFTETLQYIETNAKLFYANLSKTVGLRPVMPQGAMYMMVGVDMAHFPAFKSDVEFTERMVTEQSVFCLPAKCFQYPNFFRIVLTIPAEMVQEACDRINEFCRHHYQDSESEEVQPVEDEILNGKAVSHNGTADKMRKAFKA